MPRSKRTLSSPIGGRPATGGVCRQHSIPPAELGCALEDDAPLAPADVASPPAELRHHPDDDNSGHAAKRAGVRGAPPRWVKLDPGGSQASREPVAHEPARPWGRRPRFIAWPPLRGIVVHSPSSAPGLRPPSPSRARGAPPLTYLREQQLIGMLPPGAAPGLARRHVAF